MDNLCRRCVCHGCANVVVLGGGGGGGGVMGECLPALENVFERMHIMLSRCMV